MGEMLGRSNLIADIDLNALIVEDHSSLSPVEYNPSIGVESDSLILCNVRSSSFDGDHDDIPDGCNHSAGDGGTSTDVIEEDSSIPGFYVSLTPIATTDAHEIDDVGTVSGEGQDGAYSNKAFLALLKIFLLVVLALGAKKFAVGITLSAFFLFFVDYLARNVFRYEHLVPCPEVREKWRLIITRVVRLKEESLELPPESSQFEEIQIVQPRCYMEPPYRKEETDDPPYCGKSFRPEGIKSISELIEEDEDICEVPESKSGKSRRAKIKSKMKKLFPKRIGKTGKDSKLEINPTGEGVFPSVEENEFPECPKRGLEPATMAMNITPDVKDAISNSLELPEGVVEKSDFVEREKNYGYLFLILVTLVGLVIGGRIYALLLTLTWCFLSKSGGAIRRSVMVS
nr:DNA-directed RNA polymerase subunit beta like [Ipomoea batatas]